MNYEPVTAGNQTNNDAGIKTDINSGQVGQEKTSDHEYILLPFMPANSPLSSSTQSSDDKDADEMPGKGDEGSMPSLEETGIFDDPYDDREVGAEADQNNLELSTAVSTIPTTRVHKDHPKEQIIRDLNLATQTRRMINFSEENAMVIQALIDPSWIEAMQEELLQFKLQKVWTLVDLPNGKRAIGTKSVFRNKKDERGIIVRNKARLKFDFSSVKKASTIMEPNKALIKDAEAEDVDVHLYRSMIGSLMYLTTSRPDIMFVVCACARFQVTPKDSHLHVVKKIFRYLKGQPKLGLWYPRDSPFDFEAFSNSDYAGASLDRKSTTGGCQFLGKRLISWQCKKHIIVANSTTKVEYVAAANYCGQTATVRTVDNGEQEITATVDGKELTITKVSVKRHLQLTDTDDKVVYKEWEDRVERATTTAASLDTT
ncbi:hypothetical protein Tco_0893389 [Tanacetum coccineum]|uniref:Reverse transcriptase Ty1/copia-type domain-containing protein n=1 Tax=Tanacetum coccineum TaxID=301880 RepID=A0ABQ5CA85_9ASTR